MFDPWTLHQYPLYPSSFWKWGDKLPKPSGILPPPPPGTPQHDAELHAVRSLNAQRTPQADQFTAWLDANGGRKLWRHFAKQYRDEAGFVRGWIGTGLLVAAQGVFSLRSESAKRHYGRPRPFQVDPTIQVIGKVPKANASYPSGHTGSAYTAATVLSALWPARAYEFHWWARQVGLSRMHAGVHYPSDVAVGAQLGARVGLQFAELIR